MKLFEISQQHKEIESLTDEDFDAETIKDTLDGIEGEFNDKAISIVHVANRMTDNIAIIDDNIKRLQERKKAITNKDRKLRDYLLFNMQQTGINKIESPLFNIILRAGRDKVEIYDEDAIPTDYLNIKTTMVPMKRELLADMRAGNEIEGARVVKSDDTLVIK